MSSHSTLRQAAYPIEYAAVRGALAALQALPLEAALATVERVGELLYHLDRRHCRVAVENIRTCFPKKSEVEVTELARSCYRHLARIPLELVFTPRLATPRTWQRYFDFPQLEWFRNFAARGPAIFVTAHLGNWEAVGTVLGHMGIKTHAIARRLDNPFLDRFFMGLRQTCAQRVLYKRGAVRVMSDLLRKGEKLAFLIDQNAGSGGCFCDFIGRKASTTTLPATLALRVNAPILPGFAVRTGDDFHFAIELSDPIYPSDYRHLPTREAINEMTARATREIEQAVARYPQQWLWLHRRWKSRPPEESAI